MEMKASFLSLASLRPLLGMIQASNLNVGSILSRAGLPADLFDRADDHAITTAEYFRLCEQMALQGDDESCHVSLRRLMAGTSELVQARLLGCRRLSDMMEVLASSYNIIHGHKYNRVVRQRQSTIYEIDDTDFPYALGHDAPFVILSLECLLIYVHILLQSVLKEPQDFPLRRMTTRGYDGLPDQHLRFWQVPIQRNARIFSLNYGGTPDDIAVMPENSPVLTARTIYGGVADMLDRLHPPPRADHLSDRVEQLIMRHHGDQADIARQLGMSVASLRRALEGEGTSFRDIRANTLNRHAQAALGEGQSVQDVAEMLGFSDGRSFARAFRQWNGISPGAFIRGATASHGKVGTGFPHQAMR